jgi:exodeoxyribonuclease V gamma subunit
MRCRDNACVSNDTVRLRFGLVASRLLDNEGRGIRPDRLIDAWVRMLADSACDAPAHSVLVGRDATLTLVPLAGTEASEALRELLAAWREGMRAPLPLASRTALAFVRGATGDAAAESAYQGEFNPRRESDEPCLARAFPDYQALTADGRFAEYANRLFRPLVDWIEQSVGFEMHTEAVATGYTPDHAAAGAAGDGDD